MPKLLFEKTKKHLILPSSTPDDEAWVDLYTELDMEDLVEQDPTEISTSNKTASTLKRCIVDWNFTDETGQKAPITVENIKRLPASDFLFIVNNIESLNGIKGYSNEKKSQSSVTSLN